MQFSIFLFTQKRESLYLVSDIQCTSPQASSKRNESSYFLNFNLPKINLRFLKFLVLHINAFGDTRPASLASAKKPLSASNSLICNSPWQLDNNRTYIYIEAQHIHPIAMFLSAYSVNSQIHASLAVDWSFSI